LEALETHEHVPGEIAENSRFRKGRPLELERSHDKDEVLKVEFFLLWGML
jgi:hypothetical protein